MQPHLLTNFEIQRQYQNKSRFNGVYSRNNLPVVRMSAGQLKNETYIENHQKCNSVGSHCIALYESGNNVVFFDSFGVEKETKILQKEETKRNLQNTSMRFNNVGILL